MRILVVGAGAIGGYFGGRMLEAGRDVTFLVRPRRAAELADAGLVIKSPNGDVTLKNPPTVQADKLTEKFDVVLLSCKAFDLDDAIKSFAPAVGPQTAIVPLLNGMLHLDVLDGRFGSERVLGGLCAIAATLNDKREVVQLHADAVAQFRRTRRQVVERGFAPSRTSWQAAISVESPANTSSRKCGRSGYSWLRWRRRPA